MASKNKESAKQGKKKGKAADEQKSTVKESAVSVLSELERTAESLGGEIKHLFDGLADRASRVVSSAAETTASVADKVVVSEPAHLVRSLIHEIRSAGETSLQVIGERFEALRKQVTGPSEAAKAPKEEDKKKKKKKKASDEKAAAEAEQPAAADTAAGQPEGSKEAGPAKRPAETAVAKKTAAKKAIAKKAAAKKTVAKKAVAKKAVAKKTAAKKAVAKKAAAKSQTEPSPATPPAEDTSGQP